MLPIIKILFECFSIVAPIFIIIGIGYIARRMSWIHDNATNSLNKIVFHISFPTFIVYELSKSDPSNIFQAKGAIAISLTVIIVAIIGYITAKLLKKPVDQIGVWSQASFRSNTAFFGIPMIIIILGDESLQYAALTLSFSIPLGNVISIIVLYMPYQENKISKIKLLKEILNPMIKNPMIISCLLGYLLSFIRPEVLPNVVEKTIHSLKGLTTPLSLLAIGSTIQFQNISIRPITPVFYKLLLSPLIAGIILYFLSANRLDMMTTILLAGSPITVFSYIMVVETRGDKQLAANLILTSSLFSFFSYTLILIVLKLLNI